MIPFAAAAGTNLFSSLLGGGGMGGFLGGLGGLFKKGMPLLGGLGSLLGNQQAMKYFDQGRNDIQNLPGMQGPANLMGDFGSSVNGMFGFNPTMSLANLGIGGTMGSLLAGQGGNQFGGIDLQGMLANLPGQQQLGAMNTLSGGQAGNLFGMGMQNMQAAGNQQGLYDQSLQVMRDAYAPQRQVEQNQLFDDLYSKGLLGAGTATQGQNNMLDRFFAQNAQADLGFQNQAFDRAMAQQNFLGNLGSQQVGQGFGAENQAWQQALGSLAQNQQFGLNRLQQAQGLFDIGQNAFAQNYGLGLQGAETLLGYGDFGLRGAAMPYQLQAGLLQGGGYHAQALADLAAAQADASSGFLGGMFG